MPFIYGNDLLGGTTGFKDGCSQTYFEA